jgi:hypothetical protein
MDVNQFKDLIVVQTLQFLDPEIPYSESAVNLLLLTWATESHGGRYIKQLGDGPALGVFQMEPATYRDLWRNYLSYKDGLAGKVNGLGLELSAFDDCESMIGNLYYATAMARVHYYRSTYKLPVADDVPGLAKMWKTVYNTHLGKGTVDKAIADYHKYVLDV